MTVREGLNWLAKVATMRAVFFRITGAKQPLAVTLSLIALLVISLLASVLVVQLLSEGRRTAEYQREFDQSREARSRTWELLFAIQAVENRHLHFLLKGQREALNSYHAAVQELDQRLEALERVDRGNAVQATASLKARVDEWLAALAQIVAARQQSGTVVAEEGAAQSRMDDIRGHLDEMLRVESQAIAKLADVLKQQRTSSQLILFGLFGGILVMTFAAGLAGLLHIVRRHMHEQRLREAWKTAATAQQEAERANRAKSDFLATISHEIRTPLHAVVGSTELLLDHGALDNQQRELVERIETAGAALLNVVNAVLDLSKIEAGGVHLESASFSVRGMVDNAISIAQAIAQRKRLALKVEFDRDVPVMLVGDSARIRQVLLNLLQNALKFTEFGEVRLNVEHCGSCEEGERLRFSISDTGPGIPAQDRERLFKRFSQLDTSARREGTGLGLEISRRLVELMGGQIGFESELGRGSTFWFSLALPQGQAALDPLMSMAPSERPLSGRILVVDDVEQNRDLARKMLEASGYSVDEACDGSEAVAATQAVRYDLVLMDVQMPGMGGVEATKMIRQLGGGNTDVPIIAMTANVLAHDLKTFINAGMNDHLGKPFKRKELITKMRTWLHTKGHIDTASPNDTTSAPLPIAVSEERGLRALQSMMGQEWVARGLSDLNEHLEATFGRGDPDTISRATLAGQAHMLVSRAGILGFSELSQLCSALEQTCKTEQPLSGIFARAQSAARHAQAVCKSFLQEVKPHLVRTST